MTEINTNIDDYTSDELLDLVDLHTMIPLM